MKITSKWKGKTYEEIFGIEKAKSIKNKQSRNTAFRKLQTQTWCKGLTKETDARLLIKSMRAMGHRVTDNTRKKIGLGLIGNTNHLGHRNTIESKEKMSISHKGVPLSERHKSNIRKHLMTQFQNKKPTSIEIKVYSELKRLGVLFEKQKLVNNKFLVDAYIPALNLIIEADGDYWHSLEHVQKKDRAENAYLKKCGFSLLRIPEHAIKSSEFDLEKLLVNKTKT